MVSGFWPMVMVMVMVRVMVMVMVFEFIISDVWYTILWCRT